MASITNEDIYNNYFKDLHDNESEDNTKKLIYTENSNSVHTKEITPGTDHEVSYYNKADGNISNIEDLVNIVKQLCNAAWGNDWGEMSLDIKKGEDSANIKLPQIIADINTRDISEGLSNLKPLLTEVQKEIDENGNETGDAFLIYRQWFDANIEFDIYGNNPKECRELCQKFEELITIYSGYLKRKGLSEIFFLREISPKSSLNFSENIPMRCILYYVRFENITPVRVSVINSINTQIGANRIDTKKVRSLIEKSKINNNAFELDFFDGDNEITCK
jgi:hypothetical protein